jgi:TPR repeat protein
LKGTGASRSAEAALAEAAAEAGSRGAVGPARNGVGIPRDNACAAHGFHAAAEQGHRAPPAGCFVSAGRRFTQNEMQAAAYNGIGGRRSGATW